MTDEHDELIDRLRDADTRAEFREILYEWDMERKREAIAEAISESLPDGVELTFDKGYGRKTTPVEARDTGDTVEFMDDDYTFD